MRTHGRAGGSLLGLCGVAVAEVAANQVPVVDASG